MGDPLCDLDAAAFEQRIELGQVAALQPWRKHLFAHIWPGKPQT
jgi:hypothetical protein